MMLVETEMGTGVGDAEKVGKLFFIFCVFFFQAEDGIRDGTVTGVQTCALPIYYGARVIVGRSFPCAGRAEGALRSTSPADVGTRLAKPWAERGGVSCLASTRSFRRRRSASKQPSCPEHFGDGEHEKPRVHCCRTSRTSAC